MKNIKRFFVLALLSLFLISSVWAVECGEPFKLIDRELEPMEIRPPIKSEGFERIEQLASLVTGGKGVPIEQRRFIGQVTQQAISTPLGLVTLPEIARLRAKQKGVRFGEKGFVVEVAKEFGYTLRDTSRGLVIGIDIGMERSIIGVAEFTKETVCLMI